MVTGKERSTEKERQAQTELEQQGYLVTRAGASLGMFDLIAVDPISVRFIQIKRTKLKNISWSGYYREIYEIQSRQWPSCCSIEFWIWQDYKGWTRIRWYQRKQSWLRLETNQLCFRGDEIAKKVKSEGDV